MNLIPIIKLFKPFDEVAVIKIYPPYMKDFKTIAFPVLVDAKYAHFELNHNNEWHIDCKIILSECLIALVCKQIALKYDDESLQLALGDVS